MSDEWCTIESDPGVFTELMESLGVVGVQVDELWSMDDESLGALTDLPVYGLIFLFKWQSDYTPSPSGGSEVPEGLFFAKQTITNACATQAMLSVLLNATDVELGSTLTEFQSFTSSFPPDLRGEAIGASDEIRTAHNSFARRDYFLQDGSSKRIATKDDDVFHFIAYVPFKGTVYELDGLQNGPVVLGQFQEETQLDWIKVARTAIQKRMELYASSEIKFNLMAITQDRRIPLRKSLETNPDPQLQADLITQEEKRKAWTKENERRRHNYVPLCVELLKALAASGELPTLVTEAKERVAAKSAKVAK